MVAWKSWENITTFLSCFELSVVSNFAWSAKLPISFLTGSGAFLKQGRYREVLMRESEFRLNGQVDNLQDISISQLLVAEIV